MLKTDIKLNNHVLNITVWIFYSKIF